MANRSKKMKIDDLESAGPSKTIIDWNLCIICQEKKSEDVLRPDQNPIISKRNLGYETLANNLMRFKELGYLKQCKHLLDLLVPNSVLGEVLITNSAKWHKSCFLKYKTSKLQRLDKEPILPSTPKLLRKRAMLASTPEEKFPNICLFCDKGPNSEERLSTIQTKKLENKIREYASKIKDTELISRVVDVDLIASEKKYHGKCINKIYKNYEMSEENKLGNVLQGIAFADIINYIEIKRMQNVGENIILKMPKIYDIYNKRLQDLYLIHNVKEQYIHNTRLREQILEHVLDMRAEKAGKEYILTCDKNLGNTILNASNSIDNALAAFTVAKTVRESVRNRQNVFEGEFNKDCQQNAIDPLLLSLVNNLLYGSNESGTSQVALSICQLIIFNMQTKRFNRINRHFIEKEPPLPIYLALLIHSKTGQKDLVNCMNKLGLSISYDRLLGIYSNLCNMSIDRYTTDGAMCPPQLKLGLFTTAAYDNLDHNPSSTTSVESFHGTSLSLFQQPLSEKTGRDRTPIKYENNSLRNATPYPANFSIVSPTLMLKKDLNLPSSIPSNVFFPNSAVLEVELSREYLWLKHNTITETDHLLSWSIFHARDDNVRKEKGISTVLPCFYEDSKSTSMMMHAFNIFIKSINFLNNGQVPVITMDQPLYALAKSIQWNYPKEYGEKKLFILFGSLHIEQAFLKVLGQYLDGSGWTELLVKSNVVTAGVAESFIKVSHITKTRMFHQITATVLYQLMHDAYIKSECNIPFNEWRQNNCSTPMFKYWSICLDLQILLLLFIRSHRVGNFNLYIESIKSFMPWFFLFNHTNYSRWLSIYLTEICCLEENCPSLYEAFQNGLFVLNKTARRFSSIGLDQAHEQNNATIKGVGGAINLTQNSTAFRRWMLSGPEIARLLQDFQEVDVKTLGTVNEPHHEESISFQNSFNEKVKHLKNAFEEVGNPFLESGKELFSFETNLIMEEASVTFINNIEDCGLNLFKQFIEERISAKRVSIYSPIKKNKINLFNKPKAASKSKSLLIKSLKSDVDLFSRLFIVCLNRDLDIDEFFQYENTQFPPSLATAYGTQRCSDKSVLTRILENVPKNIDEYDDEHSELNIEINTVFNSTYDCIVYDGPALVHILVPRGSNTFAEYSKNVFQKHIIQECEKYSVKRIDIVWDVYKDASIKGNTRELRGPGTRRQVKHSATLPKNWSNFLNNSENKSNLFELLARDITTFDIDNTEVFSTYKNCVLRANKSTNTLLLDCNHEEADSRIFVHVLDAVCSGHKKICIRTVDTDVVVIACAMFFDLKSKGLEELWIHFGSGKHFRQICIHQIVHKLGEQKSKALLGFHSFSGCDTVSYFSGRGKTVMWKIWKLYPDVTEAFLFISQPQSIITNDIVKILERFTILTYCQSSDYDDINKARKDLFSTKSRSIGNIPPSRSALEQHILRAAYQSGHIWGQSLKQCIELPPLENWGWILGDTGPSPNWTSLPAVSDALQQLIQCSCKACKASTCSCRKSNLACTLLCKNCKGSCL